MIILGIIETVEYDFVGGFLSLLFMIGTFVLHWAPIILLVFIARILWLIYKLERNKSNEKKNY